MIGRRRPTEAPIPNGASCNIVASGSHAVVARQEHPEPHHPAARSLTAVLASDAMLEEAFAWVCRQRRDWPPNVDIWWLRRDWPAEKRRLQDTLLSGRFTFGLLDRVSKVDGSEADLRSARDAVLLKALTLVLAPVLPVSSRCTHIKGNGGAKGVVRQVSAALAANRFVLRSDVKPYYASIDHMLLLDRLAARMADRNILNLAASICVARQSAAAASGSTRAAYRWVVR